MRKLALAVVAVALLIAARVSGVELKQSAIQSMLRQNLSVAGSDDFDYSHPSHGWKEEDEPEWGNSQNHSKSVAKAALYSTLVPGWGEYYVGHKKKARVFFTVEVLSWIGFIGFTTYGNWKEDDFIRLANERAGADLNGKDDWFLDMVGFYDDIDEYNSFGRVYDPDRPYLDDNASNHWRWQNPSDKELYRHLKNRSREANRRADFMIGLLVLNRVVSVIDAVRDAKRSQRIFDGSFGQTGRIRYRFDVNPFSSRQQISFTLFTPI
jgi:hypothetical protein